MLSVSILKIIIKYLDDSETLDDIVIKLYQAFNYLPKDHISDHYYDLEARELAKCTVPNILITEEKELQKIRKDSTIKKLIIKCNKEFLHLTSKNLPPNITQLQVEVLNLSFGKLDKNTKLETLILEKSSILTGVEKKNFPPSLRCIVLSSFAVHSKEMFPDLVETIIIKNSNTYTPNFSSYIDYFPKDLKTLIIECGWFNTKINRLSKGLIYLSINGTFNRSVNKLPITLKRLKLLGQFNRAVNKLPKDLEELILGGIFNKKLNKLPNLRKLALVRRIVTTSYKHALNNLPECLKELELDIDVEQGINDIPDSVEHLKLGAQFFINKDSFASSLTHRVNPKKVIKLPKNLKLITVPESCVLALGKLFKKALGEKDIEVIIEPDIA